MKPHGVPEAIAARVRTAGPVPFLTYYDIAGGGRTELSAVTFANWVDKTVNMIADLDIEPGDEIALPVLADHPGHWVGAVWALAAWVTACPVRSGGQSAASRLVVTGPAGADTDVTSVACSLHPLGLGFSGRPPADYDYADVLTYPDAAFAEAWLDPESALSTAAWADTAVTIGDLLALPSRDDRVLIVPDDPQAAVLDAVVRPLLGRGSTVVVVNGTAVDHDRLAAQEKAVRT